MVAAASDMAGQLYRRGLIPAAYTFSHTVVMLLEGIRDSPPFVLSSRVSGKIMISTISCNDALSSGIVYSVGLAFSLDLVPYLLLSSGRTCVWRPTADDFEPPSQEVSSRYLLHDKNYTD
jgi:hypothetical protein